ncbi:MAG: restriction endonuclease subunit S [Firmicutes bacterium]|nr:restriction endonuclease subunit S [Bacillota bacterium]
MSKWEMVRLGGVGAVITGNTPKTSDVKNYDSDDLYFVKPSDIAENVIARLNDSENYVSEYARRSCRIVPQNSVLVTCIGIIGKIGVTTSEVAFNQQINAIVPDADKCNHKFLAYAISRVRAELNHVANAAVVPIINKSQFSDIKIPLPPLDVQKKIADILDHASALIEKRKAQIAKLDLLVKSQFAEMFGDPVTNSMGWDIKPLGEITNSRLGKMLDAKKQTGENNYPYLANFNVQWFRIDFSKLNEMDFNETDRIEFALEYGDLLVCEGGEVGRTAIWENEMVDCFFQKAIHRVRCDINICIPEYMAWIMYQKATTTNFDGLVTSATIAHLTGEKLKRLMVQVPPLDLQHSFAEFIHAVDESKTKMRLGLDKLELLHKSLMQKCFNGEVL